MTDIQILHGNCLDILPTLPDCSVDSIVTDPPYGLEFMGKDWDAPWKGKASREFNEIKEGELGGFKKLPNHSRVNNLKCQNCDKWKFSSNPCKCDKPAFPNARLSAMVEYQLWFQQVAAECLRVLKPGGHLLAFGGTRTYHRMAVAIEDAGFEIRDSLHWIYGSGFPKSLDVSKAIDKQAGAEREVIGYGKGVTVASDDNQYGGINRGAVGIKQTAIDVPITAPATDAAKGWQGWGTALKPAHEPIVVARKPLIGTVAGNVLQWGTGAINIDGTRVAHKSEADRLSATPQGRVTSNKSAGAAPDVDNLGRVEIERPDNSSGRWPANIVFTHNHDCADICTEGCPVRELDGQSGTSITRPTTGGTNKTKRSAMAGGAMNSAPSTHNDSGGASRFFTVTEWDAQFRYVAKPGKRERNAGLKLCECDKLSRHSETEKSWDNEDQQAQHPEDTEQSQKRDTDESGTPTSSDSAWSTSSSGNTTTGQSPKDIKSTTPTTTNLTTELRTFNLSTAPTTSESTPVANCATINGGSPAECVENLNQSTSATGTSAKKVGRSTDDADPATSESLSKANANASSLLCPRCDGVRGGHPTVKPLALMRWLVRLVTPPNGTVLEPFAGSGTTLVACHMEGFNAIGIEMTDEYLPIIEGRLEWARQQPPEPDNPQQELEL
jgi:site-specific DNA-methyltransferase (adenine-specific)